MIQLEGSMPEQQKRNNALWNCKNPNQGKDIKVLCVCSAGLLRSPTAAKILVNNGFNTRSAGVYDYALIPVDEVLLEWADHIIFMEDQHKEAVLNNKFLREFIKEKSTCVLEIPDMYDYDSPSLNRILTEKLKEEGFLT